MDLSHITRFNPLEFVVNGGPWVQAGAWLMAGLIAHYLLARLFTRLHDAAAASRQSWDDVVISALESPARAVLWIVVAHLILASFPITEGLRTLWGQAYDTALVLLLAWFLQRLLKGVEEELITRDGPSARSDQKAAVHATAKLLRIVLWVIVGIMVLQTLGLSVSGLLAFGGIGGIAVGFAAKDLLANFFGGLSIYLDRPFTKGDWIRSPDRQLEGTVEDIGWRLTRIRSFDQRPLYVPNAVFSQIAVENPSRMRNRRIYETIGLRYSDADKMELVVDRVRTMLEEHVEIDPSRTLIVNFVSFGPSSLDFFVYTFTRTTDWVRYHAIKQEIMLSILAIIHELGADVAFPTQTLQVELPEPEPEQ